MTLRAGPRRNGPLSYDADGDLRLTGSEHSQYEREVGERRLWNYYGSW